MRFLGIGECADLADLYLRLVADGHEVKIFIGYPLCRDTLAGLIQRVDDWQARADVCFVEKVTLLFASSFSQAAIGSKRSGVTLLVWSDDVDASREPGFVVLW